MNGRRGFLKSLAKAAAIVALAPQIAFRTIPEKVVVVGSDPGPVTSTISFQHACVLTKLPEHYVLHSKEWNAEYDQKLKWIENLSP